MTFIQRYLAQLPGNPQVAWQQLSPGYQAEAGGYQSYSEFWSAIRAVRIDSVTRRDDYTDLFNLTYIRNDGSVASEQRWFRVDGGRNYITGSGT